MVGLASVPYMPIQAPQEGESEFTSARGLVALGLIVLSGIPWAAKMTIPNMIIARAYGADDDVGLKTAVLNISLCFGQLLVSMTTRVSR